MIFFSGFRYIRIFRKTVFRQGRIIVVNHFFVCFISGNTWNTPFQAPFVVASVQVAGGKYVTFDEVKKTSILFMILNLIGMVASIPLWQALGLIF